MKFRNLKIHKWQQFNSVDFEFHSRLTILTGANGSGKTTLLNLLARHASWTINPIATPTRDESGVFKWLKGLFNKRKQEEDSNKIGEIVYNDGTVASLAVKETETAQYGLKINNKQSVESFFIPSHRTAFRYHALDKVKVPESSSTTKAFSDVDTSNRERYLGGANESSSFYIKNILISWSLFGRGNEDMDPDDQLIANFKGFEKVLKKILPDELGFLKFKVTKHEVVLECETENFILDASSGGIGAIIELAWQIYMFGNELESGFTVIIDELENHLHPTMQRRLLPDLLEAFPKASFIVSTHSPLIVGSVQDSAVYVLRFVDRQISSTKLDLTHKAKSAADILDEVLGVSFTMPVWAEKKLREIVDRFAEKTTVDKKVLKEMRADLERIGLEDLVPEAISDIVSKKDAQTQ